MIVEAVAQLSEAQIADLERLYQGEWWTQGRQRADIRRMLAHSDIVVAFCGTDSRRLAAFARVLTDYVYKALIFDVIVDPAYRGTGLGRMLLDAIMNHPDLREVRHFELYCLPELVTFYEQWGFTDDLGRLRFMRRAAGAAG